MSARRTPVDRMILSQQQGPDSIIMAGWGLIAVFAFLFAFGAWKFNSTAVGEIVIAQIEPAPEMADDTLITGSISASANSNRSDTDVLIGAVGGWQPETRLTDTIDMENENDELRAEVIKLRRALDNIKAQNTELFNRLANLESSAIDPITTASISQTADVEPRLLEAVAPARPIPLQSTDPNPPAIIIQSTQFAIDLGGFDSRSHAREGWQRLKNIAPDIVFDLRPRTVAVTRRDGEPELRLLGGPYANMANAAQTCAALSELKIACRPGELRGQELAMR